MMGTALRARYRRSEGQTKRAPLGMGKKPNPKCCTTPNGHPPERVRQDFTPPQVRIIDVRGDEHPAQMSPLLQSLWSWMEKVAARAGMPPPELLSGARSPQRQQQMRQMWDKGMREGLAYQPSRKSKHVPDAYGFFRAFDLANDLETWIKPMGEVVSRMWPNIEWGGTYLPPDWRHFEER